MLADLMDTITGLREHYRDGVACGEHLVPAGRGALPVGRRVRVLARHAGAGAATPARAKEGRAVPVHRRPAAEALSFAPARLLCGSIFSYAPESLRPPAGRWRRSVTPPSPRRRSTWDSPRGRLQAGGLRPDLRLFPEACGGQRPHPRGGVRQVFRRPADVRGFHLRARKPGAAGPLPRNRPAAGAGPGYPGGGPRTGRGGQRDRLDRFRPARHRGGSGAAGSRARLAHGDGRGRRDAGHPAQCHPHTDPRDQPRRAGHGGALVRQERRYALRDRSPALAVPEVRRAR